MANEGLREKVKGALKRHSSISLEIAWDLFVIRVRQLYLQWGFENEWDYYKRDLDKPGLLSVTHAYDLANVGELFYPQRTRITQLLDEGKIGIAKLIDWMRLKRNEGCSLTEIMARIEHGESPKFPDGSINTETHQKVPVMLTKGDIENCRIGAVLYAVHNAADGHNYFDRVVQAALLECRTTLLAAPLPPRYEQYRDLIFADQFYCKFCSRYPLVPNMHHVIPVSIGQGHGPQVLLCQDCHLLKVQPRWRHYAERWFGGKRGIEKLLREIEQIIGKKLDMDAEERRVREIKAQMEREARKRMLSYPDVSMEDLEERAQVG